MNPFTLWVIAHHAVFKEVLSRTSLLCDKEVLPYVPAHSLEDALVFYEGEITSVGRLFSFKKQIAVDIFSLSVVGKL